MPQDNQIKATDKELKDLIEWMLDSYSIRENLKALIVSREKMDQAWLLENFGEAAKPNDERNTKRRF